MWGLRNPGLPEFARASRNSLSPLLESARLFRKSSLSWETARFLKNRWSSPTSNTASEVAEQLKDIGARAVILLDQSAATAPRRLAPQPPGPRRGIQKPLLRCLPRTTYFEMERFSSNSANRLRERPAAGEIVTFGVTPDHPATGYGYIHPAEPLALDPDIRRVERFVEKPDEQRAKAFIESGFLWNSGNFVFRADVMLEELQRFEPEIAAATAAAVELAKKDLDFIVLDKEFFANAPKTSIDYAVMERTKRAAVLAADVGWSDVGEWSTVWRLSSQDADGNSLRGRAVAINLSNVLVRSDEHLAAVIGLKDVIVIATGDAILVADKSQSHKVKQLVERLKAAGMPEATEHRRAYRPWGYYQSIDNGSRYQVKRIVVRPGGRLRCKNISIGRNTGSSCAAPRK